MSELLLATTRPHRVDDVSADRADAADAAEAFSASAPLLGRAHARRLREIYRSAGWPCLDMLEVELLAAGMVERAPDNSGFECLRVTQRGLELLADTLRKNRATRSAHEELVERVSLGLCRAGRIAWRGLALRAQVPNDQSDASVELGDAATGIERSQTSLDNRDIDDGLLVHPPHPTSPSSAWCVCKPDVFSIRNTTVAEYVEPVVHEIKVRRADLLGDLKRPYKRASYLDLGETWYVLGADARGRPIGTPDEIPPECGVMLLERGRLVTARAAPRRRRVPLPHSVWMVLAKATPVRNPDEGCQALLGADEVTEPDRVTIDRPPVADSSAGARRATPSATS